MKKEFISPLCTLTAMVLLIISRLLDDDRKGDIIMYLAILVALLSMFYIVKLYRKSR